MSFPFCFPTSFQDEPPLQNLDMLFVLHPIVSVQKVDARVLYHHNAFFAEHATLSCVTSSSLKSVNTFAASTSSFYAEFRHVSVVFDQLLGVVISHVWRVYSDTLLFSLAWDVSLCFPRFTQAEADPEISNTVVSSPVSCVELAQSETDVVMLYTFTNMSHMFRVFCVADACSAMINPVPV